LALRANRTTWLRCAAAFSVGLMQSACLTMHAYEPGERDAKHEACVAGNMRIGVGQPVLLYLRRVDHYDLTFAQRSACMSPGAHDLMIDCTVTESKETSRHHLAVDLDAGRYRLIAETKPGNRECDAVRLERTK
jgi:hypothetical protein